MQRRQLVVAAAATLGLPGLGRHAFAADAGVAGAEIVLGQSAILSGPLGNVVKDFTGGARLCFDHLNAQGGVHGRSIRLVSLDDELKPDKAVANCKALLSEHQAFAFFGNVGSGTIAASTAVFRDSHAPLVGNFAVSDSAREQAKGAAYFVRATYGREAEKLVQHLATIGIDRIAVATLDNPGGAEVLALVRQAMAGSGKDVVASAAMKSDGSNIVEMGQALAAARPQAVIVFVSGPPVAKLMSTMWDAGTTPAFYGMSVVDGALAAKLLGTKLRGLATSQVMPYPWSEVEPTAKAFRQLCEAAQYRVSYVAFEGYFNALVMAEGLKRAGRDLRRSGLHAAMQSMKVRLAGVDLDYTAGRVTGSRYVDLVLVTPEGRFVR